MKTLYRLLGLGLSGLIAITSAGTAQAEEVEPYSETACEPGTSWYDYQTVVAEPFLTHYEPWALSPGHSQTENFTLQLDQSITVTVSASAGMQLDAAGVLKGLSLETGASVANEVGMTISGQRSSTFHFQQPDPTRSYQYILYFGVMKYTAKYVKMKCGSNGQPYQYGYGYIQTWEDRGGGTGGCFETTHDDRMQKLAKTHCDDNQVPRIVAYAASYSGLAWCGVGRFSCYKPWNYSYDPGQGGQDPITNEPEPGPVMLGDVSGDGWDDIVAIKTEDGTMRYYGNNWNSDSSRPYGYGRQVGTGWGMYSKVMLGDVTGDGFADLLGIKPDGTMWYYGNNWNSDPNLPYKSGRQIGSGWGMYSKVMLGDVTGDGFADLLGIKPDGTMWYYGNNWNSDPNLPYKSGRQIGSGWGMYDKVMLGDVTGDGYEDIMATKPDGTLWYYGNNWNTDAQMPYKGGSQRGNAWDNFNRVDLGDVSGDGWDDLVGTKPDGTLWYYGNNYNSSPSDPYGSGRTIGESWGSI